jgi:hypothetical protein
MSAVTPTTQKPSHHIRLYDPDSGANFYLLLAEQVRDAATKQVRWEPIRVSETAFPFRPFPLEQQAIKMVQGQSNYDSMQWPYMTLSQQDWSGGRGVQAFEDDRSKYTDGYRADTLKPGRILLGPKETWGSGTYRVQNQYMPSNEFYWMSLSGGAWQGYAQSFVTPTGGYTTGRMGLWLRSIGSPGSMKVSIYSNSGGSPNTLVGYITIGAFNDGLVGQLRFGEIVASLSSATTYWITAIPVAEGDAFNHWEVGAEYAGGSATGKSWNGTAWSASTYNMYYRVLDNTSTLTVKFFDYKQSKWAIFIYYSGANSKLYVQGDKGVADSNHGALTTLVDASKTWTENEWTGAKVHITAGPGSDELQPWRTVTGNSATALTVDTAWSVEHTTATEYAIVGVDTWRLVLADLGGSVTDVAVAGEFVYFAFGDSGSTPILRFQWYNSGGAEATRISSSTAPAETVKARSLVAVRLPEEDQYLLLGSVHNHSVLGTAVFLGSVPRAWGKLYSWLYTPVTSDTPWDEQVVANVTQSTDNRYTKIAVAAAFTTGVIASEITSPATGVDFTNGKYLAMLMKSDVANDGNDVQIGYSSVASLGGASAVFANLDAWDANTLSWVTAPISPIFGTTADGNNGRAVISVGLKIANDQGAQNFWIYDGVQLIAEDLQYIPFPAGERIQELIVYDGNTNDPRINPWVRTDTGWYEIQMQNSNAVVPLNIQEMAQLTGLSDSVTATNDVYLWFNMKRWVQRYYSRTLENIGPDKDDVGLPFNRIGGIADMVSFPGRMFVAFNAGFTGYSSVMVYKNNGWHEFYRAPYGMRIKSMSHQNIPGNVPGRLWVNVGTDLIWLPVSLDPEQDALADNYYFTHQASVETGWMYANMRSLRKLANKLSLFSERGYLTYYWINCEYKIDDDTDWNLLATSGGYPQGFVSPFDGYDIATLPVENRRIKLRFTLNTQDLSISPKLVAWTLDEIGINDVKYGYRFTVMLADKGDTVTLEETQDVPLGYAGASTVGDAWDALSALVGKVFYIYTCFDIENGKKAILQPLVPMPVYLDTDTQVEKHIMQVTLYGV